MSPMSGELPFRIFPLRTDQTLELGIPFGDMQQYARMMAEDLAMLHWVGEIDGDDVKFVLAPPSKPQSPNTVSNVLAEHTIWRLDNNLCRKISTDVAGMRQAVKASWRNDPYYPRPDSHSSLWSAFREQYLNTSEKCMVLFDATDRRRRQRLPKLFIGILEKCVYRTALLDIYW